MKKISVLILAMAVFLFSCQEEKAEELLAVTMSCDVDGQKWQHRGSVDVRLINETTRTYVFSGVSVSAVRGFNGSFLSFQLVNLQDAGTYEATADTISARNGSILSYTPDPTKVDSIFSSTLKLANAPSVNPGSVVVTSYDKTTNRVVGTFNFTLRSSTGNEVQITNGQFDAKLPS